MNNEEWIEHHRNIANPEVSSAKYNGFVYDKSTASYRQRIRHVIEYFSPKTVIDVCCGSGDVTGPLAHKFQIFGLDAVELSCTLARKNGLKVECCRLQDYQNKKRFGVILCCEAITLLDDPKQLFKFFNNSSTKQGCLIVAFVNKDSLIRKAFNLFIKDSTLGRSVDKYSIDTMHEMAADHQLKLVRTDVVLQYAVGAFSYTVKGARPWSRFLATNLILTYKKNV